MLSFLCLDGSTHNMFDVFVEVVWFPFPPPMPLTLSFLTGEWALIEAILHFPSWRLMAQVDVFCRRPRFELRNLLPLLSLSV